jgi:hypothetical protein
MTRKEILPPLDVEEPIKRSEGFSPSGLSGLL